MALDDGQLACGRLVDEVWQKIEMPPDDHEAGCSDCQAARERLTALAEATREMAQTDSTAPELQPGPRVKANIMDVARAEVRRGRLLPLRQDQYGAGDDTLQISEQAIAGVVRASADEFPGVHARRCRVTLAIDPDQAEGAATSATAGVVVSAVPASVADVPLWAPAEIRVRLTISVSARLPIPSTVATLRDRVAVRVNSEIGIRAPRIDVVVEDLHDD